MKLTRFAVWLLFLVAIGCAKSSFRYGSSGADRPSQTEYSSKSPNSINETIHFGRILQEYLGKPYSGHSCFDPGLDCSLFTSEVFKKYAKIQLPRKSEDQFKSGSAVNNNELSFGDLVFFNTDGKSVSHVGIYVGFDEFIHASTSNGVTLSKMDEKYWSKRFVGARRVLK